MIKILSHLADAPVIAALLFIVVKYMSSGWKNAYLAVGLLCLLAVAAAMWKEVLFL